MKAFIGKYYKTLISATKAYNKLSKDIKKHKSLCEVGGRYFIVGNSTIRAFNGKK